MKTALFVWGTVAALVPGLLAKPLKTRPQLLDERANSEPCAIASSAAAAYLSADPEASYAEIPAEIAYKCLLSIPFLTEPALDLVQSLKPYLEVQSTIDLLRAPPEGYLYDAVDIPAALNTIQAKIENDEYDSEYTFQSDVEAALLSARDGHLTVALDVFYGLVQWSRSTAPYLVSVSEDGLSLPLVYAWLDVVERSQNRTGLTGKKSLKDVSNVVAINGLDVQTWINADANSGTHQDPDANWNNRFLSIQKVAADDSVGHFASPTFYPGPTTTLRFANGTETTYDNTAVVLRSLNGVSSGDDLYKRLIQVNTKMNSATAANAAVTTSTSAQATATQSLSPAIKKLPFYPIPEVIDPSGIVSGYFVEGSGNEDLAVLVITSFLPRVVEKASLEDFQAAVQNFLTHAAANGKTKLILDVQGNGGGAIDLATDTFAQLFPDPIELNSKNNMRASTGMYLISKSASKQIAAESGNEGQLLLDERLFAPVAYQSVISDNAQNFSSFDNFYGPYQIGNGQYTSFAQGDYTNDRPFQVGLSGIIITGTNNRTGFKQHFERDNIVLLTDGYCASACTLLAEHLKNKKQVKQITLGGRPQIGPMQAVGGVKGSMLFPNRQFVEFLDLFYNHTFNAELNQAIGTVWENFSSIPIQRSVSGIAQVNGYNQYRIGDQSQTALQFVYEAADARLWYTPDMVASPMAIWQRVAEVAFQNQTKGEFVSPYIVEGSTGHPTSVTGGLKEGDLGPQTLPKDAKYTPGWLVDGATIVQGSGIGVFSQTSPKGPSKTLTKADNSKRLGSLSSACSSYTGSAWLVTLMCNAVS